MTTRSRKISRRLFWALACSFLTFGSLTVYSQKEYSIAEIQGDKAASPHDKEAVRVTGVVTAILKNGFFIQTPDALADKDPKTSDGLYVYGPNSVPLVSVGNMISVDGTVSEFVPRGENSLFHVTELTKPTVRVVSKDNPLP